VIIGLGNPKSEYAGTPHNIGYEAVDRLVEGISLKWGSNSDAWIARGIYKERSICLVKINMPMNLIGAGLLRLSEKMMFGPEQCILVFDDLALPLGTVRTRLNGSAGGHRGVASILEAFQTNAFRRIKIGTGQECEISNHVEYVLTPFDAKSRAEVEPAIATAQARILEMVAAFSH
jgi:aminoacyl-tRNA hydrolase